MPPYARACVRYARVDAGLGACGYLRAITTLLAGCQAGLLHCFGAGDLTGLEGGEAGGLYAGLGAGF